jgi:hypothetical protein
VEQATVVEATECSDVREDDKTERSEVREAEQTGSKNRKMPVFLVRCFICGLFIIHFSKKT